MSDNQDALLCADALERRGYASLTMQTRLADHEIAAHIRRLHAENEALRADAERYRAMRSMALNPKRGLEAFVALSQLDYLGEADSFDAAIDAARSKE